MERVYSLNCDFFNISKLIEKRTHNTKTKSEGKAKAKKKLFRGAASFAKLIWLSFLTLVT